jgi:hypothetical protein
MGQLASLAGKQFVYLRTERGCTSMTKSMTRLKYTHARAGEIHNHHSAAVRYFNSPVTLYVRYTVNRRIISRTLGDNGLVERANN